MVHHMYMISLRSWKKARWMAFTVFAAIIALLRCCFATLLVLADEDIVMNVNHPDREI